MYVKLLENITIMSDMDGNGEVAIIQDKDVIRIESKSNADMLAHKLLEAIDHEYGMYKITSNDVNDNLAYDAGFHNTYRAACEVAEKLSNAAKNIPFRVYRFQRKDRIWVQEAYYLNGE